MQEPTRRGAGQDRAADPAVSLASKWEDRRSKQACFGIAMASRELKIVPAAFALAIRFAPSEESELARRRRAALPSASWIFDRT